MHTGLKAMAQKLVTYGHTDRYTSSLGTSRLDDVTRVTRVTINGLNPCWGVRARRAPTLLVSLYCAKWKKAG